MRGFFALLLLGLLVSACATPVARDGAPRGSFDSSRVSNAVPRSEPRTIAGNKSPYTVLGRTYHVLPDSQGYREQGVASWYGTKFHGRRTANGEVYDMFKMTAAHKTLPIPSYVRVVNLDNQQSVVVRVNDRGPFHDNRIIDLSYAAAHKLGMAATGTANVLVEAIEADLPATRQASAGPVSSAADGAYFLQAGAFSSLPSALKLKQRLDAFANVPVFLLETVVNAQTLYRVRLGPIADAAAIEKLKRLFAQQQLPPPQVVRE